MDRPLYTCSLVIPVTRVLILGCGGLGGAAAFHSCRLPTRPNGCFGHRFLGRRSHGRVYSLGCSHVHLQRRVSGVFCSHGTRSSSRL